MSEENNTTEPLEQLANGVKEVGQAKPITPMRAFLNAILEARKVTFPKSQIDAIYTYPLYVVEPETRSVRIMNGIRVLVTKSGRINYEVINPDFGFIIKTGRPSVRGLLGDCVFQWQEKLRTQYEKFLFDSIFRLEAPCPAGWEGVRATSVALDAQTRWPGYGLSEMDSTLRCYLAKAIPFLPTKYAGIKHSGVKGMSVQIKKAVLSFIATKPENIKLLHSFLWRHTFCELNPNAWNRLLSVAPILHQITQDNRRLRALIYMLKLRSWVEGAVRKKPDFATLPPKDALQAFRADLMSQGLTPATWRWLTHLSPIKLSMLYRYVCDEYELKITIPFLNRIVESQIPCSAFLTQAMNGVCGIDWPVAHSWLRHYVQSRNCSKAIADAVRGTGDNPDTTSKKQGLLALNAQMRNQLRDVLDYLGEHTLGSVGINDHMITRAADVGVTFPFPPPFFNEGSQIAVEGMAWKSLVKRSADWHQRLQPYREEVAQTWRVACALIDQQYHEAARFQEDRRRAHSWESLLPETQIGNLIATPLTTGAALIDEGINMRHCVAGYAELCANNKSRIFSIKDITGKSLATLELTRVGRVKTAPWAATQVRGKCNAPVSKLVQDFSNAIAVAYTQSQNQRMSRKTTKNHEHECATS